MSAVGADFDATVTARGFAEGRRRGAVLEVGLEVSEERGSNGFDAEVVLGLAGAQPGGDSALGQQRLGAGPCR